MARPANQTIARLGLAALLTTAGVTHFTNPGFFRPLVPPLVPPMLPVDVTVYGSGVAEIAIGLALVPARWQRPAGFAAAALFVGVFPGNIYAAFAGIETVAGQPDWFNWARLPAQVPLVAISLWLARRAATSDDAVAGTTELIGAPS